MERKQVQDKNIKTNNNKKKKKIKNERCLKFPVFKVFHTNLRSFTSELNIAAAASTCFSPTVSGAYSWWSRLVLRFSCRQKWITTQEVLLRRSRTRRPSGRQTSGPSFQECVDLMLGVKKNTHQVKTVMKPVEKMFSA